MTEFPESSQKIASFLELNEKLPHTFYKVNLKIIKAGKLHTIGEYLLLPAAEDRVDTVLGEKAAEQLNFFV